MPALIAKEKRKRHPERVRCPPAFQFAPASYGPWMHPSFTFAVLVISSGWGAVHSGRTAHFGAGIKCHLGAGHLQTKGRRPICRYKQCQIRKPPSGVQEIENCACMRRVLHKGQCCLLNSVNMETPPCSCVQGRLTSSEKWVWKLSTVKTSPSAHLLSALLFSARIDWNARRRECSKVRMLELIQVVSVPEITGRYWQAWRLHVLFFKNHPTEICVWKPRKGGVLQNTLNANSAIKMYFFGSTN